MRICIARSTRSSRPSALRSVIWLRWACSNHSASRGESRSRRAPRWSRCSTRPRRRRRAYMRQSFLFDAANYYPGTQWRTTFAPGMVETRYTWLYPGLTDFDNRGMLYNYSWGSGERLGSGTYYINLAADAKGQPLDGSRSYRLRVPAKAPVTQFWSATTQDDENGVFMDVPGRVALASTDQGVVKNAD